MAEAAPTVVVAAACTAAATLCACTAASSLGLSSGASGSGSLYGKAQRSGEPPEEEYGDEEIVSLEAVWGKGFLSPGGPAEVGALLAGPPPDQHDDGDGSAAVISLRGKHVLDIGAGSGGIDLLLVQQYGAAAVHAVDCEQGVLDRAAALWREADIPAGVISTQRVSREWYLSDEIEASPPFDVVFSKDSIVHVENKAAVMKALFRVLKPGGVLCISDWMCSEGVEAAPSKEWQHYLEMEVSVRMKSLKTYTQALESAGFANIRTRDRNEWYTGTARAELAAIRDGEVGRLVAKELGAQAHADMVEVWARMQVVLERGEHRPAHIYAVKPAM